MAESPIDKITTGLPWLSCETHHDKCQNTSPIHEAKPSGWDECFDICSDTEALTSFSNPNYQLTDDALNSNINTSYYSSEQLYNDVDNITSADATPKTSMSKRRKKYAQMDLSAMGIDLDSDPSAVGLLTSPDSLLSPTTLEQELSDYVSKNDIIEVEHSENDTTGANDSTLTDNTTNSKGFMGYYTTLALSASQKESDEGDSSRNNSPVNENVDVVEEKIEQDDKGGTNANVLKDINSPDSNDSGIQADEVDSGQAGGLPDKNAQTQETKPEEQTQNQQESTSESTEEEEVLPVGWEKHTDEDGAYYWHIKSGTIQREPPPPNPPSRSISTVSSEVPLETPTSLSSVSLPPTPSSKVSVDHLQEFEGHAFKYATESLKTLCDSGKKQEPAKQQETTDEKKAPEKNSSTENKPIRFAVRSLGWVRIDEEDLTPERSSKAVNKCIVDLSLGRNDINDVVGRWGDGKDLFMDLDNQSLNLIDPQDMSVLNCQPIHSIRVWGVGRDNGRDFAYVARDRSSRRHMCHVFRCDTPARQIANTLRDICKKILMERSMQQKYAESGKENRRMNSAGGSRISRPNNLPNLEKAGQPNGQKLSFQSLYQSKSFPTPMEEPKKVLRCHFLGTAKVPAPTGIDVLNAAIEKVYARVPPEKWVFVSIAVAPSTLTISEHANSDNILAEARVRFLSFMGIAMSNVKLCAYITHSANDQYVAHVFHAEPSAGALCKTIEAACKLRYQKCLDAHPQTPDLKKQNLSQQSKEPEVGLTATLKAGVQSMIGLLKGRKT